MTISGHLLFFFSALGAFNGLLLAAYLFFLKPKSIQQRLLSALIFMISMRISKSIWFYFDPNIGKQFLQLGLSACFLIGPFLYFYTASNVGKLYTLKFKWTWHLGLLLAVTISAGILFPYQSNTELWGLFYRVINLSWGAYILLAGVMLLPRIFASVRNQTPLSKEEWLSTNVFVGTALIWFSYFTSSYTSYIVGALSFSFILYVSVLLWFYSKKYRTKVAKPYANKKIDKSLQTELIKRLTTLMSEEKLYKNSNLTLPLLAKKMHISVPQLSQLINDNLQKSFNDYVNEWRIEEAKQLLKASPAMTIEVIAEASGYNSQSTFYSAFNKFEQTTPARFRSEQQLSA
ncbi:helix-turn-helix domain-containing protein [Flocculibacter collagenilyticus]|uniref:helix-turn-helix domain-containing protein n=1 Tax=Flocculibacter collagenilyticus TaxID=2744479 RepID=UPI0018F49E67|nr:helix-turn-helix domain-containing protein [Flocculibacter collagenilyticus]